MGKRLLFVVLASALMQLNGCATIFSGTTEELKFDANVPGVRLTIDGQFKGTLPLTVNQSRDFMHGQEFIVKFEAPGYVTQEFKLKREFNWIAVLDITSIPTSGGIDYYTGALMRFEPNEYHIQMQKKGRSASEFERSKRLWQYALVNYRRLQLDLARGRGEYLESLASALSTQRRDEIREHALRHSPTLLEASDAHDFVRRLNDALGSGPGLRAYRM